MVGKIGVIGGSSLLNSEILKNAKLKAISSRFGKSYVYISPNYALIQRHGPKKDILPHLINHRANIFTMKKLGITKIIGIGSVGSLKKSLKPGSIVVPDDFIDLSSQTFFTSRINEISKGFIIPELDKDISRWLIIKIKGAGLNSINKGAYFFVKGPRLETRSEIRMFSKFGDIIGMTLTKEAVLSQEIGIKYAALCIVDNYANGINDEKFTHDRWERMKEKNYSNLKKIFFEITR